MVHELPEASAREQDREALDVGLPAAPAAYSDHRIRSLSDKIRVLLRRPRPRCLVKPLQHIKSSTNRAAGFRTDGGTRQGEGKVMRRIGGGGGGGGV